MLVFTFRTFLKRKAMVLVVSFTKHISNHKKYSISYSLQLFKRASQNGMLQLRQTRNFPWMAEALTAQQQPVVVVVEAVALYN